MAPIPLDLADALLVPRICPSCGAGSLRPEGRDDHVIFWCADCGGGWYLDLGYWHAVDIPA
jgi:Zn-finger nucleic acid-binding protein